MKSSNHRSYADILDWGCFFGYPPSSNAIKERFTLNKQTTRTLMKIRMLVLTLGLLLASAYLLSCNASSEQPLPADDKEQVDKGVPVETSMHDFMEGVFQGSYRRLKQAMSTDNKTNATWKIVRGEALTLAEGGNLLLLRKPKQDVNDWVRYSVASRDAGAELFKAAKKKDAVAAKKAYGTMLQHCNACHKQFDNGKNQLEP